MQPGHQPSGSHVHLTLSAVLMRPHLLRAKELLGDKGYDSSRFRKALIAPCIPSTRSRKIPIPYDKALCRQRHRIENMFGHIDDRHRVAVRYGRCTRTFLSAICLAATVLFWINAS